MNAVKLVIPWWLENTWTSNVGFFGGSVPNTLPQKNMRDPKRYEIGCPGNGEKRPAARCRWSSVSTKSSWWASAYHQAPWVQVYLRFLVQKAILLMAFWGLKGKLPRKRSLSSEGQAPVTANSHGSTFQQIQMPPT